jgi:iron complex transport system substrate-binding protein
MNVKVAIRVVTLAVLSLIILLSCSGKTQGRKEQTAGTQQGMASEKASTFPMVLSNYNILDGSGAWQSYEVTFEELPKRIVGNTQGAVEFLIKLGLADRIIGVGALYGEPGADVQEQFKRIPVINPGYMNKEQVLGADPDFVFGRGDLFNNQEFGVGTADDLSTLGIRTYLMHSSQNGAGMKELYQDIDEIGILFDVGDTAAAFKQDLMSRVSSLEKQYGGLQDKTYCCMSMGVNKQYSIFGGPRMSVPEEILSKLGLSPVNTDMLINISNEQLIDLNPDVILLLTYSGIDGKILINSLKAEKTLESVTAIRNGSIFTLDFAKAGYSFRIVDEVERIAPLIHPGK